MFGDYPLAYQLMKDLAQTINGHFFAQQLYPTFLVVSKDDLLIYVEFNEKSQKSSSFMVLCTFNLLSEDADIRINKNQWTLGKTYYKNDIFQISVSKHEDAKALAEGLINDFEFVHKMKELFKPEYHILLDKNNIKVEINRSVESSFAVIPTLTKEDLIQMIEVIKEIKAAITFYEKRNNPL